MGKVSELAERLTGSEKAIVFSGAGISAESGISTYRGTGGAMWDKYDPNIFANINYFLKDSTYYWEFFRDVRYPVIEKARPNPGHDALVRMESKGLIDAVITQNIDGLHRLAGSKKVFELHGNTRVIKCLDCGSVEDWNAVYEKVLRRIPPPCEMCHGRLKPDVVFFGEPLPQDVFQEAARLSGHCDLLISVGSSLSVYPAAHLPVLAKNAGAALAIINIDETPFDPIADWVFSEPSSNVLDELSKQTTQSAPDDKEKR